MEGTNAIGRLHATRVSGAGNRFYLVDARAAGLPQDAGELARAARRDAHEARTAPDGLLFALAGEEPGSDLRMVLFNADGSRPEACGNALRCLADWAVRHELLHGGRAVVDTDGGPRDVRWRADDSNGFAGLEVSVSLGAARAAGELECGGVRLWRVDLANPHAVGFVASEAELAAAGHAELAAQVQARVPGGVNVELVVPARSGVSMRVFERGVGETNACGTGSAAAAWVAAERQGLEWPVRVRQPGGILTVDRDGEDRLWLSGPVATEGSASYTGAAWVTCSTS